jgi:hypothetical protein
MHPKKILFFVKGAILIGASAIILDHLGMPPVGALLQTP